MLRVVVATLILLANPLVASGDVKVVFGPSPDLPEAIVKAVDGARWTLDVAIYSLDHSDIVSAIEKRAQEGIRVRLILNKPNDDQKLADRLEAAGVDVRFVNVTMHHKFAIVDSTALITGSCNWTRSSFARYDEDLLTFKNEQPYVDAFRAEFEKLWSGSQEYGKTVFKPTTIKPTKLTFGRVVFTSANMAGKERLGKRIFSTTAKLPDGVCGRGNN